MSVQNRIKDELIKEIYSNVDNIYDFIESRYKLDTPSNDAIIKKLNELKDLVYKVSNLSELS
ncbi:MAG: hypothetical protein ACNI3C_03945 [Candidatus Marinarcus sp.]|uniref:hypothetical protein n=1 Tax=Candidatus Marinarcus sp. TaxID=3100987 RepID=UPI003B007DC7